MFLAGIFGLLFGSFGTVLATRLGQHQSIVSPRSRCPKCQHQLSWRENLPLLSYLIQRGKCRHCGEHISLFYPVMELATAFLFALTFQIVGLSTQGLALVGLAIVTGPLTVIDLKHKRLPNPLTLTLFVTSSVAVCATFINGDHETAYAAAISGAALFIVFVLLRLISRGGMGLGDVKLAVGLGLTLGLLSWKIAVSSVILAFLIAAIVTVPSVVRSRTSLKRAIPFGPFLLLGSWLAAIAGPSFAQHLLSLWGVS